MAPFIQALIRIAKCLSHYDLKNLKENIFCKIIILNKDYNIQKVCIFKCQLKKYVSTGKAENFASKIMHSLFDEAFHKTFFELTKYHAI